MAIKLSHAIVPTKDIASTQLLAEIFGLEVKPTEGRFAQEPIHEGLTIDFANDEHTRGIFHFVPKQLERRHYAFNVTNADCDGIFVAGEG